MAALSGYRKLVAYGVAVVSIVGSYLAVGRWPALAPSLPATLTALVAAMTAFTGGNVLKKPPTPPTGG